MLKKIQKRTITAVNSLQKGQAVIMIDDSDRGNYSNIIFAGESITPEKITFMLQNTSDMIYLAMDSTQAQRLNLISNGDAKQGIFTKDRAQIIRMVSSSNTKSEDLIKPDNLFPLIANDKGVLAKNSYTEATVDLMKLAQLNPCGVFCKLMHKNSSIMNTDQLKIFAKTHTIPLLTIQELYLYRLATEKFLEKKVSTPIPIKNIGTLEMSVYQDKYTQEEVIVMSKEYRHNTPLVRIHSSCITGDLFGSLKCDCQNQLHYALNTIHQEGGYVIYLQQEGRGIGLINKLKTYNLQINQNMDTIDANLALNLPIDARKYDLAIQVLKQYNVKKCKLLSNNPDKKNALKNVGIKAQLVKCGSCFNKYNKTYLQTKIDRMNHQI
ncbi:MAG: GTP-cyclohydrolase II [Candidatus Xenolissoclinum pacificiensis L6]|uniref:3,4-dihydroxy-2-butanone 4-phosphate synthase n=1 Tax=Candidatus Xenolissoclinum pacificiensis L6 TaxID=1401685 RepID=W2UZM9_9RICK|nr:MAG: GTP-cyclohydrolase II [Candidatus Xenolissoclinum pacificiensis L6]